MCTGHVEMFKVERSRVEVRTSCGGVQGDKTVLVLDIRCDGDPAPAEWWKLVNDIQGAARELHAEKLKLRAKLRAMGASETTEVMVALSRQ